MGRKDGGVVQQFALFVKTDKFGSGTITRIQGQNPFFTKRSGQEQLAQIVGEDLDRLDIGSCFKFFAEVIFQRWYEEPSIAVFNRSLPLRFAIG